MMTFTRYMFVLAAGCLMAQAPIGMGPGKLVRYIELPAVGHSYGDTPYFSAWLAAADAVNLPVPSGLPIIGTGNDGTTNIRVHQLDTFDWNNPGSIHATLVNAMSSYGTESATNTPSGWWAYCTQIPLGSPPSSASSQNCSWKSREPVVRGGCIYLPVERQETSGISTDHDATIVKSCDAGKTWLNPYSLTHSGTPDANGDAPKPLGDASYPGSIMWPQMSGAGAYGWSFIQYGQDGSLATVTGGCDPSVYTCATLEDGSLARVPNGSIMDPTAWTYYSGRITANSIPDGNNSANWTPLFNVKSTTSLTAATGSKVFAITAGLSGLSNGTRVYVQSASTSSYMEGLVTDYTGTSLTVNVDAYGGTAARTDWNITPRTKVSTFGGIVGGNGNYGQLWGVLGAPAYLKEFKSYLWAGFYITSGGAYRVGFMAAPQPWGPWKTVYIHDSDPAGHGFPTISLAVGYTVVSANPPIVRVTNVTNGSSYNDFFQQWEFSLGRQPYGNGEVSAYTDIGIKKLNSGWVFGAGDVPGTFNRKGLVWAFDFMDHGGDTASKYPYFHDVANNSAILYPCYTNGPVICGVVSSGIGLTPNADSMSTSPGYNARYESRLGELSNGASTPNLNAPAAMTGNGSYTVVQVVKITSLPSATAGLWESGNSATSGASVALVQRSSTGYLQLWFGGSSVCEYAYQGTWAPTNGNWYFIAAVVSTQNSTAGSAVGSLWAGVGGVLSDKFAGLHPTPLCGGSTWPPNVAAKPLLVGNDGATDSANASYAGLLVYNRALSVTECQGLYRTFKTKMSERGIVVQ